jgi:hypothetical protein
MKKNILEAGTLQVPSNFTIPIVDVPYNGNGIKVWKPTKTDLESGVVAVLQEHATVQHIGGNHKFLVHENPPTIHHPDKDKHTIYWLDQFGDGQSIVPWTDQSWELLAQDRMFLNTSDALFSQMQSQNEDLRVFHAFGFAQQSDGDKIAGRKVDSRGVQSQYRGHLHLVDGVNPQTFPNDWMKEKQILKSQWLLPFFLNTAGELAIQNYSTQLKNFGERVTYSQSVGAIESFDIQRTMFAYSSWEEALNSVVELYSQLYEGWLNTAAMIGESKVEFSGAMIDVLQGAVPGFMIVKPSEKDKKAGGISEKINWLVLPFNLPLPQVFLQPGVLFNRLQPDKQKSI